MYVSGAAAAGIARVLVSEARIFNHLPASY